MRTIFCLFALLVLSSAQVHDASDFYGNAFLGAKQEAPMARDPKIDLGNIFNGFWEEGGLTDQTKAIECFDEPTANLTLIFIGDMLRLVDSGNVVKIPGAISQFEQAFPNATFQCLIADPEVAQLQVAYNISNTTYNALFVTIEKYLILHVKSLHDQAATGYFYYQSGKFRELGLLLGRVTKQIVGAPEFPDMLALKMKVTPPNRDPKTDLGSVFNGFWEEGGLSDQTKAIACFDEPTANLTLIFIGDMLRLVDSGNVVKIPGTISAFEQAFPSATLQCLENDPEVAQLQTAYNISNTTLGALIVTIEKYIILHVKSLHDQAASGYSYYHDGKFTELGRLLGRVTKQIVGAPEFPDMLALKMKVTPSNRDPKTDLGYIFNGFWEEGGLSDQTKAIECFDEPTANLTLIFIGDMLRLVDSGNVVKIPGTISAFEQVFPSATLTCLEADPEVAQLQTAYNISNTTYSALIVTIEKYIILHVKSLHDQAASGYSYYHDGKFTELGRLLGRVTKQIVGGPEFSDMLALKIKTSLPVENSLFVESSVKELGALGFEMRGFLSI